MSHCVGFRPGLFVLQLALLLPTLGLLFAPGALQEVWARARAVADAPAALEIPEDMRCRPNASRTDQILLQWDDTNDGIGSACRFEDVFQDFAVISGVREMMISNRADFGGAVWEPYTTNKLWTLQPDASGQAVVFVLFKDASDNVSDVTYETFAVDPSLLPDRMEFFLPRIQL